MLYSKWIPDRGGYAYYETSERRGISDDLPIPRLNTVSSIGAASTEIGRSVPLGAKIVGYGPLAKGSVAPLDRSGLSGILGSGATNLILIVAVGIASAVTGSAVVKRFLLK